MAKRYHPRQRAQQPPQQTRPIVELGGTFLRWDGREPGEEHGPADAVYFRCPHHEYCSHIVPFTPDLAGTAIPKSPQKNGAHWRRSGSSIETLTLSPSVKSPCGFHGHVRNGLVVFCGDSK